MKGHNREQPSHDKQNSSHSKPQPDPQRNKKPYIKKEDVKVTREPRLYMPRVMAEMM